MRGRGKLGLDEEAFQFGILAVSAMIACCLEDSSWSWDDSWGSGPTAIATVCELHS